MGSPLVLGLFLESGKASLGRDTNDWLVAKTKPLRMQCQIQHEGINTSNRAKKHKVARNRWGLIHRIHRRTNVLLLCFMGVTVQSFLIVQRAAVIENPRCSMVGNTARFLQKAGLVVVSRFSLGRYFVCGYASIPTSLTNHHRHKITWIKHEQMLPKTAAIITHRTQEQRSHDRFSLSSLSLSLSQ